MPDCGRRPQQTAAQQIEDDANVTIISISDRIIIISWAANAYFYNTKTLRIYTILKIKYSCSGSCSIVYL